MAPSSCFTDACDCRDARYAPTDGRTGIDVLTQLRKVPEFRDIPVLIVTGSILTDDEKATIAKLRGFVFFKPEGFSTIVNFLDHLTGRDQSG